MKIENLPANTRLDSLGIPELDVVLDEIFFIPSHTFIKDRPKTPQTIGELMALSPVKSTKIVHLLKWVLEISTDSSLTVADLQKILAQKPKSTVILDVRSDDKKNGREIEGAISTWTIDWNEWLPKIKSSENVVVICDEGKRSFSAAMQLRDELKIEQAKYLEGGMSNWPS